MEGGREGLDGAGYTGMESAWALFVVPLLFMISMVWNGVTGLCVILALIEYVIHIARLLCYFAQLSGLLLAFSFLGGLLWFLKITGS